MIDEGSESCSFQSFEEIFVAANLDDFSQVETPEQHELQRVNSDGALMRFEFLQCLTRVAIAKFVVTGESADVSEAVDRLLTEHIEPYVPAEAKHDADVFRTRRLYTPKVHELLAKFEPVLRTIFEYYSTVEGDPLQLDLRTPEPGMSMEEWLGFLTDAGLVESEDSSPQDIEEKRRLGMPILQPLEARLTLAWSQMFVSDELRRRFKLTQATYEDFLEALGRVCTRLALPSVQLLEKYVNRSAFEFFQNIEAKRHDGGVLLTRGVEALQWQVEEESDQPLHPTLEMLIGLVLDRLDSDHNGKIDQQELVERRKKRVRKREEGLRTRHILHHDPADAQVLKLGSPGVSQAPSEAGDREPGQPSPASQQRTVTF